MRSVIALSIGLAFSTAVIAAENNKEEQRKPSAVEKTQMVVKDIFAFAQNNPSSPHSTTEQVDKLTIPLPSQESSKNSIAMTSVPLSKKSTHIDKQPIKQDKKLSKKAKQQQARKKERTVETIITKPSVSADNTPRAVLLNTDSYHIPADANLEDYEKFSTPIKYSDIDVIVKELEDSDNISVSFIDKRIGKPLDKFYFHDNKIQVASFSTNLIKVKSSTIYYGDQESYIITPSTDECNALLIEYKLKTQETSERVVHFIDKNEKVVKNLPQNCNTFKSPEQPETIFTTNLNQLVNIGYNHKALANKHLGLTLHFMNNGKETIPHNLKTFAVAKNFSQIYIINPKHSANGSYFGIEVLKSVVPQEYNVIIEHQTPKGIERFITGAIVKD